MASETKCEIKLSRVIGNGRQILRARCSCNAFVAEAARLETASRRKMQRQIDEHLAGSAAPLQPQLEAAAS